MAAAGWRRWWLGAGLLLLAFNLRPCIAAVAPLLPVIRRADHLSAPVAGLLTTVPLVLFAAFSPSAPVLVRRFGSGRVLVGCLAVLVGGVVIRSLPGWEPLAAGTVLIGVSLAVANLLMPGIVKAEFAGLVGVMTGLYTVMLNLGISIASGVSVPLRHALGGWRLAIGFWAAPAFVALLVWVPLRRLHRRPTGDALPARAKTDVWRSASAWWLTAYMGLQSLNFFALLAWLPTILQDRGTTAATAGALQSVLSLVAIGSAFLAPVLATNLRQPGTVCSASTVAVAVGLGGLLLDPGHLAAVWVVALGLGQGSAISLVLMLMVVHSRDPVHAVALSGMSQGVGYLVAAVGPAAVGAVYAVAGAWAAPLAFLLGLTVAQFTAGWRSARLPAGAAPAGSEPVSRPAVR